VSVHKKSIWSAKAEEKPTDKTGCVEFVQLAVSQVYYHPYIAA